MDALSTREARCKRPQLAAPTAQNKYSSACRAKNTGIGRKRAPEYKAVFERPLREENGLDKREAEWVRAQPARLAFDRTGNDAFNDVFLAE